MYIVTLFIYLTYTQSITYKMPGWMEYRLKSRLLEEIPITSNMQMTHSYGRKQRQTKEPLEEDGRGE